MYKKTISYIDYEGNKRTEDFYFNISTAEAIKIQVSEEGGLEKAIDKMVKEQDQKKIVEMIEYFIRVSYGEKSADGKRFVKSQELSDNFLQTEAYSVFFMELCTNSKEAANFIKGIMPNGAEITDEQIKEEMAKLGTTIDEVKKENA